MTGTDHPHHPGDAGAAAGPDTKVIDPVCGMTVDPAKTAHHAVHAEHPYHFCSAGCRTKFVADPDRYLRHAHWHGWQRGQLHGHRGERGPA